MDLRIFEGLSKMDDKFKIFKSITKKKKKKK